MSSAVEPAILFTIGFTKTTAEHFFERLTAAGVRVVLDTRLNRGGQLSGFAKDADLRFFLDRVAGIAYRPAPLLAPTADLLDAYRKRRLSWSDYAFEYRRLLSTRGAIDRFPISQLDRACLLCSESAATHCHRGVAADLFEEAHRGKLSIRHL